MAYQITLTSGNVYKTVADGTINADSAMVMIGKDFSGYGQYIDQNIIRLLESGASTLKPTNQVLQGELWFDQSAQALKVAYQGGTGNSLFQGVSMARTGANAPANTYSTVQLGDLWYYDATTVAGGNAANNVMRMYTPSGWRDVGPLTVQSNALVGNLVTGTANSGLTSLTVLDAANIAFLNLNTANIYGNLSGTGNLILGSITANTRLSSANLIIGANIIGLNISSEYSPTTAAGNITSQVFFARTSLTYGLPSTNWDITGIVPGGVQNQPGFYGNVFANVGQQIWGYSIGASTGRIGSLANPATQLFGVLDAAGGQVQPNITSITSSTNQLTTAIYSNSSANISSNTNIGYYGPTTTVIANSFYGNSFVGTLVGPGGGPTPTIDVYTLTVDNLLLPALSANANARAKIYGSNGDAYFNRVTANSIVVPDGNLDVSGDVLIIGNLRVTGNTQFSNANAVVSESSQLILANNVSGLISYGNAGIIIGNVLANSYSEANPSANLIGFIYNVTRNYMNLDKPLAVRPTSNTTYATGGTNSYALVVAGNIGGDSVTGTPARFFGSVNDANTASDSYFRNQYIGGNVFNGNQADGFLPNANIVSYVISNVARSLQYTLYNSNAVAYGAADQNNTANTAPVRDSNGNIYVTASMARYADLAEKYLLDQDYPQGTLLTIGGSAEATACSQDDTPFGVISTNPGFVMNEELVGGVLVALKGRVPVRVIGSINKGDKLGPSTITGVATVNKDNYIAIALHSVEAESESIVEAVVL